MNGARRADAHTRSGTFARAATAGRPPASAAVPVHVLRPGVPGGLRVVLAHGLEDGWAGWRPLAERLDPDWRVLALDLPWRAGSDYRWRQAATPSGWLGAGLEDLGEPVDAVLAHSFGANALLDLACARDPRPAPRAVLVCPLYRPVDTPVTWRMLDRSRQNFVAHIHEGVRVRLGRRAAAMEPDVLAAMMAKTLDRVGPIGLLTVFDQFVSSTALALDAVEQEALVLAGTADPTLPPEAARALADALPRSVLRVNDGFDHFCHIRRPDMVAAQVDDFLRTAPRAAPTRTEGGTR